MAAAVFGGPARGHIAAEGTHWRQSVVASSR
jgi:hypothetical protein